MTYERLLLTGKPKCENIWQSCAKSRNRKVYRLSRKGVGWEISYHSKRSLSHVDNDIVSAYGNIGKTRFY